MITTVRYFFRQRPALLAGTILFVGAFALFGAACWFDFSVIDDQYLIVANRYIRGPTLRNIWHILGSYDPELYIPVTLFTFQLNYLISGLSAWSYHATNILLHAGNAVLLMLLARRLLGALWPGFVIAVLFLVHPLTVEAVVWVAGRKDLLAALFALASTHAYVRYRETHSMRWIWWSVVALALSLLSKSSLFLLPLCFVLLDWGLEHRRDYRRMVSEKLPHFCVSIAAALIALGGKTRVIASSPPEDLMLLGIKSTSFYLTKIVWPSGLTPFYPWTKDIALSLPEFFVPFIILSLLFAALFVYCRWSRVPLAVAASALLLLAPTFANAHKGETIFFAVDRYAYAPMLVLFLGAAVIVQHITRQRSLALRTVLVVVFSCTVAGLAVQTMLLTRTWSTDASMLRRSIALIPDNVPARTSLAMIARESGQMEEERRVLEEGIILRDDLAYRVGLGSIAAREGRFDDAMKEYERAHALDPDNPEPYFYQGSLEESRGDTEKALTLYRQAIALDDSYVAAINNAGAILMDSGRYEEAEKLFRDAIRWNPNFVEGEYNISRVLAAIKKLDESRIHLWRAYELAPDNEEIALSAAYAAYEDKDVSHARRILQNILRMNPSQRTAKRLLDLVNQTRE